MSDLTSRIGDLEQLCEKLVAEVVSLREAKQELTEENAALRQQKEVAEAAARGASRERETLAKRAEKLVEGIDSLLESAEAKPLDD